MTKRRKKSGYMSKILLLFITGAVLIIGFMVFIFSLRSLSDQTYQEPTYVEPVLDKQGFIDQLVSPAQEMHANYGVLPSIILAQAILESDWGTSDLGAKYYNLFGIKSYDPNQEFVTLETKEFQNGKWITIDAKFRVYDSWADCIRDHTQLFVRGVDWDPYLYQGVLLSDNYQTAAKALQVAGYATDPDYANKLITIIEENGLSQYDS